MFDLIEKNPLPNPNKITCHSGGAEGSDLIWEKYSVEYGLNVKAYSYQTSYHKSPNKVELTKEEFAEGAEKVYIANEKLKRKNIDRFLNLLARNWFQVKFSKEIFAVGQLDKKKKIVKGGTGYAVQMAINNNIEVNLYNQIDCKWYKWSYILNDFKVNNEIVKITHKDFGGIGTRNISKKDIEVIKKVFINTFE